MRYMRQALFAFASVAMFASGAGSQTLPFSYAYTAVRDCSSEPCSEADLDTHQSYGYDFNASSSTNVIGRGFAADSVSPGTAGAFALPVLHARADVQSAAAAVAFVYGFQGYINTGNQSLDLAFTGSIDWNAQYGYGFVLPSIAILTDAVADPTIGTLWTQTNSEGGFVANCSTPGALAVVSGPAYGGRGGLQTASIDTSTGTCGGNTTVNIAPGQRFYVLSRLLAYQELMGSTDASNTFVTDLSSIVTPATRQAAAQSLAPIELALPEPKAWSMMLLGIGVLGYVVRRGAARARSQAAYLS